MHYLILFKSSGEENRYTRKSWKEVFVENDQKAIEEAKKMRLKIVCIIRKDELGESLVKFDP